MQHIFEISILTIAFYEGMTSRAKTPVHHVVRNTSGAKPGRTHGSIVVLKVGFMYLIIGDEGVDF